MPNAFAELDDLVRGATVPTEPKHRTRQKGQNDSSHFAPRQGEGLLCFLSTYRDAASRQFAAQNHRAPPWPSICAPGKRPHCFPSPSWGAYQAEAEFNVYSDILFFVAVCQYDRTGLQKTQSAQ
ncbi:MAG: hypothetical protein ABSA52_13045 [Candidatus Binatia bacterium]|jgi:hypothetical protein